MGTRSRQYQVVQVHVSTLREASSTMNTRASIAVYIICTLAPMTWGQFIRQQHSLNGPFESATMEDWFFAGTAAITPNYIHLTNDEQYHKGGIWNIHTCQSPDWEMQINFRITGREQHSSGDGIGIWYVKDPLQIGPVFGSKDFFSGLGVFIDTFENPNKPHKHRHPYISAMVNNGSLTYYHDEDGTSVEVGNCHVAIRNMNHITRIAVSYIEDTLTLYFDVEGLGQWVPCFRTPGVHLPTGYHFGISASTSDMTDNHNIISITTLEFNIPRQDADQRSNIIPNAEIFKAPKVAHVKPEKVQVIKPEKVQVIKPEKVQEIKPEKVQEIKPEKVKEIKPEKVQEIKPEKVQEIKPEKVKEEKAKTKGKKVETVEVEKDKKQKVEGERNMKVESRKKEGRIVEKETKEQIFKEKMESKDSKASLFTKFIYVIGSIIIITISISTCKKYFARRRESMQKRLY